MIKIGFLGAPSSGKSTVAQYFAAKLRVETKKKVELIDEYARFFVSNFGQTSLSDQYHIAHEQIDKENQASKNIDYLITDSPVILTAIYAFLNIDWLDPKDVHYLQKTYSVLINHLHSYDHLFYFSPLEAVDDGRRIHVKNDEIKKIDDFIRSFLILHNIDFIELTGSSEERVNEIMKMVCI
jgi:nicotinamide riboside kinase